MHIAFPTARWFFEAAAKVPWLHTGGDRVGGFPWFGWLSASLLLAGRHDRALVHPRTAQSDDPAPHPALPRDQARLLLAHHPLRARRPGALDQVVVGKRALAVQYKGEWRFPAFLPSDLKNKDFGIGGEAAEAPVNYRKLEKLFQEIRRGPRDHAAHPLRSHRRHAPAALAPAGRARGRLSRIRQPQTLLGPRRPIS
jgi:microcin C transport system permease protein